MKKEKEINFGALWKKLANAKNVKEMKGLIRGLKAEDKLWLWFFADDALKKLMNIFMWGGFSLPRESTG